MITLHIIGRVIFGLYFFYSGFNHFKNLKHMAGYAKSKRIPAPSFAVAVSGLLLVVGGLGFIFGWHLKASILALLLFMIPVTVFMHNFWADTDPMQKMNSKMNFMKNVAITAALLLMI